MSDSFCRYPRPVPNLFTCQLANRGEAGSTLVGDAARRGESVVVVLTERADAGRLFVDGATDGALDGGADGLLRALLGRLLAREGLLGREKVCCCPSVVSRTGMLSRSSCRHFVGCDEITAVVRGEARPAPPCDEIAADARMASTA